jgi:hypothetical protein
MRRKHDLLALGIMLGLFLWPALGEACPKCFAATGKQILNAYYVSIAFMALIPFGIVGAVLSWIYRQNRSRPVEEKSESHRAV